MLLGPNGAGKTTLISLATGLYSCQRGHIDIFGHDLRSSPLPALARLGVVFQTPTLDLDLSVIENLIYHAALHGLSPKEARQARRHPAWSGSGLGARMRDKVRAFSGGMKRRVEIARALLHKPALLIVDEATAGLDVRPAVNCCHGARSMPRGELSVLVGYPYARRGRSRGPGNRASPRSGPGPDCGGAIWRVLGKASRMRFSGSREMPHESAPRPSRISRHHAARDAEARWSAWPPCFGNRAAARLARAFCRGFSLRSGLSITPPYETYILYEVYVVPGLVAMMLLFHGLQSSLSMVYDREMGSMRVLLTAPLPRWWLLTARLIANTVAVVPLVYLFLLIARFWDVRPPALGYVAALPAIVLAGMMLGAAGLFLSSFVRQLENFAGVMNFVIFPAFFASTALYPLWRLEDVSPSLAWIARLNPFTHAVELIRFALYLRSRRWRPRSAGWRWWFFFFSQYGATTRGAGFGPAESRTRGTENVRNLPKSRPLNWT